MPVPPGHVPWGSVRGLMAPARVIFVSVYCLFVLASRLTPSPKDQLLFVFSKFGHFARIRDTQITAGCAEPSARDGVGGSAQSAGRPRSVSAGGRASQRPLNADARSQSAGQASAGRWGRTLRAPAGRPELERRNAALSRVFQFLSPRVAPGAFTSLSRLPEHGQRVRAPPRSPPGLPRRERACVRECAPPPGPVTVPVFVEVKGKARQDERKEGHQDGGGHRPAAGAVGGVRGVLVGAQRVWKTKGPVSVSSLH